MSNNKKALKQLIEELQELYHKDDVSVRTVNQSIHASTCNHNEDTDYADTVFENIVIVWER